MTTAVPNCTTSPTPPVAPLVNDLWFDTESGFFFIWYDDGNSQQWVVTNPGRGGNQGPPGLQGPPGIDGAMAVLGGDGTHTAGGATTTVSVLDTLPLGKGIELLNGSYGVRTLANLKALTSRPLVVVTHGCSAAGDGGGGTWLWFNGDAAVNNDGTVVRPTSGPAGCYKRLSSGVRNVAWFIGASTTAALNTAAIQAALDLGPGVVEFPPNTTWPVLNVAANVDGTHIRLNGATITDDATSNSYLLTINGNDCSLRDGTISSMNAPGANRVSLCIVYGDRCDIRNMNFASKVFNPRYPNTYDGAVNGLYVQKPGIGAPTQPYAMLNDRIVIENCSFLYTQNPLRCAGLIQARIGNCYSYMPQGYNYAFGAGLPCFDTIIYNMYGYGGNNYTFQTGNIQSTAGGKWQLPHRGLSMRNIICMNSGWGSNYTGDQGQITSGKSGFAIASTDLYQTEFQGVVRGCCKGGGEYKFTTLTGPVPPGGLGTGWQANPTGFMFHRIDVDTYLNNDSGIGFFFSNGSVNVGSTNSGKCIINSNTTMMPPYPWVNGNFYRPYDLVVSSTGLWLCLGDNNGNAGFAGGAVGPGVAPPAGGSEGTFSGCSMSGNVLTYTAIVTGAPRVGDVVFCGTSVPDGATITAFNLGSKTITVSAPTVGPLLSNLVQTSQEFNDGPGGAGGLWWRYFDVDNSAAPTTSTGTLIGASNSVTLTGSSRGVYQGLNINNGISATNAIADITIKNFDVTNAVVGCRCQGTGVATNIIFDGCVFDANNANGQGTGLWIGDSVGSSWDVKVTGGRIRATTAVPNALVTINGTVNLTLDGGVVLEAPAGKTVNLATAAVNKITVRHAAFVLTGAVSGPVLQLSGAAGSFFDFGAYSVIDNADRATLWSWSVSGSIAVYGQPYAADLGRANVAPTTATKAGVGEWFYITPTATVRGYVCQANGGVNAGPFTWKQIPVV